MRRSDEFHTLFATRLYQARLALARNNVLEKTCLGLAAEDKAARWPREHGYGGYTSYASLDDSPAAPACWRNWNRISPGMSRASRGMRSSIWGKKLALDSLWVNVMEKGAVHAAHIHPHSVVSGTYYVTVPDRPAPSASRTRGLRC